MWVCMGTKSVKIKNHKRSAKGLQWAGVLGSYFRHSFLRESDFLDSSVEALLIFFTKIRGVVMSDFPWMLGCADLCSLWFSREEKMRSLSACRFLVEYQRSQPSPPNSHGDRYLISKSRMSCGNGVVPALSWRVRSDHVCCGDMFTEAAWIFFQRLRAQSATQLIAIEENGCKRTWTIRFLLLSIVRLHKR